MLLDCLCELKPNYQTALLLRRRALRRQQAAAAETRAPRRGGVAPPFHISERSFLSLRYGSPIGKRVERIIHGSTRMLRNSSARAARNRVDRATRHASRTFITLDLSFITFTLFVERRIDFVLFRFVATQRAEPQRGGVDGTRAGGGCARRGRRVAVRSPRARLPCPPHHTRLAQ